MCSLWAERGTCSGCSAAGDGASERVSQGKLCTSTVPVTEEHRGNIRGEAFALRNLCLSETVAETAQNNQVSTFSKFTSISHDGVGVSCAAAAPLSLCHHGPCVQFTPGHTSPPHPPSWVVRILRPVWMAYRGYVTVRILVQRACAGVLAASTEWVVRLGPSSPALSSTRLRSWRIAP